MKFNSRFDKRSRWITIIAIFAILSFGVWIYIRSESSFLPAWITVLIAAIAVLLSMSIPRFVEITHSSVEIHCLVELTNIPLNDIKSVHILQKKDMNRCVPIAGVFGIFGYYGYYLDLREWDVVKLYAKQWNNFVMIENIYEQSFVVSVSDPQQFVQMIQEQKL